MTTEKAIADSSGPILAAVGWLLSNAQPVMGTFMLFGGALLLIYRFIIARAESKLLRTKAEIADLELANLKKDSQ